MLDECYFEDESDDDELGTETDPAALTYFNRKSLLALAELIDMGDFQN